jgi:hypothetical protein
MDFLTGKNFESTRSLRIAKKHIPEIGELWGQISEHLVHVNPMSHGAAKEVKGDILSTKFHFSIFENELPSAEHKEMYVAYNEMIQYLIQATIETVFFIRIEVNGVSAFRHPNNQHVFFGSDGYSNFTKRFKKLFQEKE